MANDTNIDVLSEPGIMRQLAIFGIDAEAYKAMPEEVRKALEQKALTPLVVAQFTLPNGRKMNIPARMQIVDTAKGKTLVLYPKHNTLINDLGAPKTQIDVLKKGRPVLRNIEVNGEKKLYMLQFDRETNSIIREPLKKMESKLQAMDTIKDIQLGLDQKKAILEGRPVMLEVGDQKVVMGVDLREPQGFRVLNGDLDEWKRRQAIAYDIAHPEYVGIVQTEQNKWEFRKFMETQNQEQTRKRSRKTSPSI